MMRPIPAVAAALAIAAGAGSWLACSAAAAEAPSAAADQAPAEARVLPVPLRAADPAWIDPARRPGAAEVDAGFRFSDRLAESGISFVHRIVPDAGRDYKPVHYDHGNGIAAADVDGDGRPDLYFPNQLGGNELWRNLGGGRFEDVTERAGVAVADRISVGASFADVDNDGDADLYVTTVRGGNLLFLNDGAGRFRDASAGSGVDYRGHSSGAVFFDYDRDGRLDLFLANIGVYTTEVRGVGGYWVGRERAFEGHLDPELAEPSRLYRNLGDGRFADVSAETGLLDRGWSGDALVFDGNDDGWPDLYVLNMQGLDAYYENRAGERFVARTAEAFPRTSWGAMGIVSLDLENDGDMDLFVTDMHSDMSEVASPRVEKRKSRMLWPDSMLRDGGKAIYGNSFFRNEGGGRWREVSDEVGAENFWPWGPSAGDLDADGFVDVFVAASMNYPFRYGINSVLLNRGGRFADAEFALGVEPRRGGAMLTPWFELDCAGADRAHKHCREAGPGAGRLQVMGALGSRSAVILDLEGDGDLDIVTNEFNSAPMVLVSDLAERRAVNRLRVAVVGRRSNRDGLGARVTVRAGDASYTRVLDGKSGYLSQSRQPLYFGLGDLDHADAVEVRWPSGAVQRVAGPVASGRLLTIREED